MLIQSQYAHEDASLLAVQACRMENIEIGRQFVIEAAGMKGVEVTDDDLY